MGDPVNALKLLSQGAHGEHPRLLNVDMGLLSKAPAGL